MWKPDSTARRLTRRISDSRQFWFFFQAVTTTVGGAILIWSLPKIGWSSDMANLTQALFSIITAFYLHDRFTWRDRTTISKRVKMRMYALAKVETVALNAAIFKLGVDIFMPLLTVLLYFVGSLYPSLHVVDLLARFGIKSYADWEPVHNFFSYCVSTVVIMRVNYLLYDYAVFGFEGLPILRRKWPRLARWVEGVSTD